METVISALITGLVAITVNIISNRAQHEKTQALIEYRLKQLEDKVDKHNNVIERTYALEKDVAIIKKEIEA